MGGRRVTTPPLPYDAEVEWLESNGSQWVDTGVIPQCPDDLTYSAGVLWSNTSTRKIMGRQGSYYFGPVSGYLQTGQGGTLYSPVAVSANVKHDISVRFLPVTLNTSNTCQYSVDGTTGTATGIFYLNSPENGTVWIFAANNATTLRGQSRIYYFSISRSGTTLRDFIPVRVGTTGYLYDRVSGTLFGNAGTGNFTIGPDK
jgi:hypothetical protein